MPAVRPKRILAVASAGGHWIQLRRLMPAFEGHQVVFVTTNGDYRDEVGGAPFWQINDANRWNKLGLVRMLVRLTWISLRERPDIVVSTGAAPGYLAVRLGKLLGARTIWVDSIANVERLSLSGQLAGRHADLWLTQWPHLAGGDGPEYSGAVL